MSISAVQSSRVLGSSASPSYCLHSPQSQAQGKEPAGTCTLLLPFFPSALRSTPVLRVE